MRIQYKGGVWKNTEDEILKAAVMKYGKNQWPRIASLLVRKSAKQCKARWFEWLDPSIKKTEWTREEEAKLLHLAKIMPTAWRTIAPMIGRTAAQCIEHYEKLIDGATRQQKSSASQSALPQTAPISAGNANGDPSSGTPAGAVSTANGGTMNAGGNAMASEMAPEAKPARPDPVDMDEDELEMLSEARARLANTKGKKAKRKSREKYLEAAKRVARLQNMRELKAAGVPLKKKVRKNNKLSDCATEIPFMRTPAAGFYDTRDEDERAEKEAKKQKQIGQLLSKYKGKSADEAEEELREKDRQKRKQRENKEDPNAGHIPDFAWSGSGNNNRNRGPLLKAIDIKLPEPQMSDAELLKLAKSGVLRKRLEEQRKGKNVEGEKASSSEGLGSGTWASQRERQVNEILSERNTQTPLHGGKTPLSALGLDGSVTPSLTKMQTPNLKSNDLKSGMKVSDKAVRKDKKKKKKERMKRMSDLVRKGLIDLPDPENEYQFEFGDKTEDENDIAQIKEGDETDGGLVETIEDAEEELRRREQKERERVPALSKRLLSEVAKRDLPAGQVNRRFGLGGGAQLDTGSVEFVVERDNAVKRILREFNQGSMNAYEALNELESLVATDGSDNAKLIKEAQEMVDQEMRKFSDEEWKGIEEVLEREFSPRKTGETRPKNLPRAVDQDYEKVEEIFQNEGKKRRHSFEVTKGNEKDELLLQSKDFDLEDLQKQVDEYYGGVRICEKAARATDELSIMNLINSLKD